MSSTSTNTTTLNNNNNNDHDIMDISLNNINNNNNNNNNTLNENEKRTASGENIEDGKSTKKVKVDEAEVQTQTQIQTSPLPKTPPLPREISILFYKVLHNMVIRNQIMNHVRLFNMHHGVFIPFYHRDEILEYKYSNSIEKLSLTVNNDNQLQLGELCDKLEYCKSMEINFKGITGEMGFTLPRSVTNLSLIGDFNGLLNSGAMENVENLYLGLNFNRRIIKDQLPSNLKKLSLSNKYGKSYFLSEIRQQLPKTCKSLVLGNEEKLKPIIIEPYNPLVFHHKSEYGTKKFNGNMVPKSAKSLVFDEYFEGDIAKNQIPENIESISFSNPFYKCNINKRIFPPTTKKLKIYLQKDSVNTDTFPVGLESLDLDMIEGIQQGPLKKESLPTTIKKLKLRSFNQILNNEDIPNVIKLKLFIFNKPITTSTFPLNITSLSLCKFKIQLGREGSSFKFAVLKHLQHLSLGSFKFEIPTKSLPRSLTSLSLGKYNKQFPDNFFNWLNNLKTIKLKKYSHQFKLNQLSNSISTLSLGAYNHPFTEGTLPNELQTLKIKNQNYKHTIMDEWLPTTLISIHLFSNNWKLINNLHISNFKKFKLLN